MQNKNSRKKLHSAREKNMRFKWKKKVLENDDRICFSTA